MRLVDMADKKISFGGVEEWVDCWSAESVFRKLTNLAEPDAATNTCWEPLVGVVQPGSQRTLDLF